MATITYSWADVVSSFTLNGETAGSQSDVAIAATADGGYLGAWSVGSAFVRGRTVDADGTLGPEGVINTTTTGNQFDASMALLGNGNNVVSFTDSSSGTDTVRIRMLGGGVPATDFAVPGLRPRSAGIRRHGAGGRRLRRRLHPRLWRRRHRSRVPAIQCERNREWQYGQRRRQLRPGHRPCLDHRPRRRWVRRGLGTVRGGRRQPFRLVPALQCRGRCRDRCGRPGRQPSPDRQQRLDQPGHPGRRPAGWRFRRGLCRQWLGR